MSARAAESGDIRRALDLCLETLRSVREKEGTEIVKLPQVMAVLKKSSTASNPSDRLAKLTFGMQLALCCITKTQGAENKGCKVEDVSFLFCYLTLKAFGTYQDVCSEEDLQVPSKTDFFNLCDCLQTQGFITAKHAKGAFNFTLASTVHSPYSRTALSSSFARLNEPILSRIVA